MGLAGTGVYLLATPGGSPAFHVALSAHVLCGALLVPVLLAFVLPHAIVHTLRKPLIALTGAVVLLLALAVAASGVELVLGKGFGGGTSGGLAFRGAAWIVHVAGGFGLFALYALHRRFGANPARVPALLAGAAASALLGGAFLLWEKADPGPRSAFEVASAEAAEASRTLFYPSFAASGSGGILPTADEIKDVKSCGTCHRQITEDWKRSAHRHASMTNPYYRAAIVDIRKRYPATDTRWCAACHDPALLFTGKMERADLDFESEDARVGLTCISCHAIEPQSALGNGDYVMRGRKTYAWEKDPTLSKAHDVLLRLNPRAHAESLRPKDVQSPRFCSLCHNAELPPELDRWKWFRTQDEYHAHDDSGVSWGNARTFYLPPQAKRCQDCHMPLVQDPLDPAADENGNVRSHIFSAANTALPWLRGDTEMMDKIQAFLETACRVDVTAVVLPGERRVVPAWRVKPAVAPGDVVEVQVVVRNKGVGHRFPGGTKDSDEVWLRFTASVGDEPPFFTSGAIDPETGEVDPSAEFYRSYLLKRDGTRFDNRIGLDVYTPVYSTVINPGSADVVRYRFAVPKGAAGTLEVRATLRYRKFMKPFVEFVAKTLGTGDGMKIAYRRESDFLVDAPNGKTIVDLKGLLADPKPGDPKVIVDMAKDELTLPIAAEGFAGPPPPIESVVDRKDADRLDRERVNDLGIALLLQQDPVGAKSMFEAVTRIDPAYVDGWINVARAKIDLQDEEGAWDALDLALKKAKGDAFPAPYLRSKAHFFKGEIFRRKTRWADAEMNYEQVLAKFPRDRQSLLDLAQAQYEQQKYDASLATIDRYLKIEPEDWRAWFRALQNYLDLGDTQRAAAARAAHDKFRPDDDVTNRRGPVLLADPNLQILSQRLHVHLQPGLED
jgi:Tfp pilus assembly protein PilF